MLYIISALIIHHYVALFTQTFFHHRYAAHRMFTMSKFWEKFFYFFSWVFQGASYLSPITYAKLHRMHHAFADTENDVHSPKYDHNLWKMMIRTKDVYTDIHKGRVPVDSKFLGNLPEWKAFDGFAHSWGSRIFWGLLYIAFYVQFATSWWMYLLLPIHFLLSPIHGAIINWFSHKYGYRNYKMHDTSTNMFPVELIMWGEALHNNHHNSGQNPNFAHKWFEFDPCYFFIRVFNLFGIIKM